MHSLSTPDTHLWAACLELKQQLLSQYITAETATARVEVVKKKIQQQQKEIVAVVLLITITWLNQAFKK